MNKSKDMCRDGFSKKNWKHCRIFFRLSKLTFWAIPNHYKDTIMIKFSANFWKNRPKKAFLCTFFENFEHCGISALAPPWNKYILALKAPSEKFRVILPKIYISKQCKGEKLSRKQKDRESYEQFWGALSDLARVCKIGINAEQEWIKDVFIFSMRNCELQWWLLSKTLNPVDALNQAKIERKNNKSCKYRIRWGRNFKHEHSCGFGQSSKFFETESAPWAKTERPTVENLTHGYENPGTILLLD